MAMAAGTTAIVSPDEVGFVERFPAHDAELKMAPLPGQPKTFIGVTEVPWEVFEIWALRLDEPASASPGTDAVARPSKPYAVIFTGFGHRGYPAMCMSLEGAKAFCQWLSKKTGKKYRLPTVSEWRRAAAGTGQNLDAEAWTWDNADDRTHPVGKKKPNPAGLFDMAGNVAEWAIDEKGEGVVLGGSWRDKAPEVGPDALKRQSPKWNESDPQSPKSKWWLANGQFIGLRVVCEIP
jgi:formylglycine-generating enzyme required for sulfatase activity